MTRNEKQNRLALAAGTLANIVENGGDAFFGNQGVTWSATGKPGDVVGTIIRNAGLVLPSVEYTDPNEALAAAIGVKKENLSQDLQNAVIQLVYVADDTKRAYNRRIPKLVRALRTFGTAVTKTITVSSTVRPTVGYSFTARGVSL